MKKINHSGNPRRPLESRRSFIKKAGAAALTAANSGLIFYMDEDKQIYGGNEGSIPWYRSLTRWGQTNITEKDPATYDISWWRSYWKRTGIQGIIVNAGGIVAYYPSEIPLHRQAAYLNGRDLFGDLLKAAREDGLAVFARMDSNRAHEEFYNAHPDWFAIDQEGKPYKAGDLFVTCVNSPYYNFHIPAILREVIGKYHPEGFTDNSWSGLGRDSICYCNNCRESFRLKYAMEIPQKADWSDPVYRHWIKWNYQRRLELWDLNNQTTRSTGGRDCIWSGMNSGSVSNQCRSFRDYKGICEKADLIMLDSQARNDSEGFQQNGIMGKLIHGLLGWEKLIPESMAMYQAGRPTFRLSAKPPAEARMWMIDGIAGGIQLWWHHVGAYHEDRRMYRTSAPVFNWHKQNEEFLINRKPLASVGVVWSQQNTDFYGQDSPDLYVDLPFRGMTQTLLQNRIPFLPVHADHIDRHAGQLSTLILPDMGVMTDDQVSAVRRFVEHGGGLIASGSTSLYDEWGDPRADFALADIFGTHKAGSVPRLSDRNRTGRAGSTRHTYLRLVPELRINAEGPVNGSEPRAEGKRHTVLDGFDETDILPFGGFLDSLNVDTGTEVVMTFIPEFPIYPPETAWMRQPKTDIPGLILNTVSGGSRIAFLTADLDRQFGRYNLPDHYNLLANIIRWVSGENIPLHIEGKGLLDCHMYKQPGRVILHIVNLTSAGTWRQPVHELIPVGPLDIGVKLPDDISGKKLKLLVSGHEAVSDNSEGWCHFRIDSITDHEVAVIY